MEKLSDRLRARLADPCLAAEAKTIKAMTEIYCRGKGHGRDGDLCDGCNEFLAYAVKRLACCPYRAAKPACGKCRIHCFQPPHKETAKEIMAYAGPRMIMRHPIMALRHLVSLTRPAPGKPKNRGRPPRKDPPPSSGA